LWILGALLIVLSVLAVMQYRWIDQLTEAQRQRTQAALTAALSDVASDFDIEITRAFMAFQAPVANIDYSERYEEWLHHAPYPNLIRGVYIADAGQEEALPKPVIPGEPPIRSTEWRGDLPELRSAFGPVTASASVADPMGIQVFATGGSAGAFVSSGPETVIDGNPAFVFPVMPSAPVLESRVLTHASGKESPFRVKVMGSRGPVGPPQWAIVVFDANYISSTFLPRLVDLYFRNSSGSDYDIVVLDRHGATSSRVVFPSISDPVPSKFSHPDGRINLFDIRLDCFSPPSSTNSGNIVDTRPQVHLLSVGSRLSEILARKPATCTSPTSTHPSGIGVSWEMLVKSRTGSLDQAVATFRRRNLVLSGTVLLVLALGISMAVLLTERARALAEMQAEFVLGVSHELRTPLTVICVAADNLKKGMVENSEQAHKYGEIIHTHATELSTMIEETLAFARLQSVLLIRNRSSVAPEQIVRDALADNESALGNAGFEIELDLAPDLPPVNVDARLMKKCLGNLIQNAIKYAAAGRWIAIRANNLRRNEEETVEMSVEDRGPGISPDDLPHIFEPFYRGQHADASQVPGIGLGLTLVKRAVEAHGGTVEVRSAHVTRFSILLPSDHFQPDLRKAV
jgi:signal transduction histidine kinase